MPYWTYAAAHIKHIYTKIVMNLDKKNYKHFLKIPAIFHKIKFNTILIG